MTKKILFPGWDSLSLEEQEAIHAWIKGLSDAQAAKRRFLDIYCFRDYQNLEVPPQTLLSEDSLNPYKRNYVFVSSTSSEEDTTGEENIVSFDDFVELTTSKASFPETNGCQKCLRDCGNDIECRQRCRRTECS